MNDYAAVRLAAAHRWAAGLDEHLPSQGLVSGCMSQLHRSQRPGSLGSWHFYRVVNLQGILLEGPPGTGKTYLAKAMAGASKLPFYSAVGSEFVEMFQGVAATRIRNLFKAARATAPSIVFIGMLHEASCRHCSTNATRRKLLFYSAVESDFVEMFQGVAARPWSLAAKRSPAAALSMKYAA